MKLVHSEHRFGNVLKGKKRNILRKSKSVSWIVEAYRRDQPTQKKAVRIPPRIGCSYYLHIDNYRHALELSKVPR